MLKISAFLALLLFSCLASAADNTVTITPSLNTLNPGQSFSVSIDASSFASALDAGGLNLSFNSNLITPLNPPNYALFGADWNPIFQPSLSGSGNTLESLDFFASGASPSGNFNIAVISFRALAAGAVTFNLSVDNQNPLTCCGGTVLSPNFGNASVSIVPEPAGFWMISTGLIVTISLKRKFCRHLV